jgi:ParB/RepB/Spo0J family partition protein
MKTATVALGALLPAKDNPRRSYDPKTIEGLAQTIAKDGLIHNLTVRPEKGKYRVVTGMRRFLALQHLSKQGKIDRSYKVPVRIEKASTADLARIATVENVQREALDPIDEAEAFAKLLQNGAKAEDLAAETGVSVPTIRRRLALADLAPEVKKAVREKALPLSVAEALTLASLGEQKGWVKRIRSNGGYDASYLRSVLLAEKPSVSVALFPVETYKGSFTKDLFADKETTYFDDREQFFKLQEQAVEALVEDLKRTFAWVDLVTDVTAAWWQYRQAKKKEPAGTVVHFSPTGRVEVRKNLARHKVDSKVAGPISSKKPKQAAEWSKQTIRYANAQKTAAMQAALLGNLGLAKKVTAILLLTTRGFGSPIRLERHEALAELAKDPKSSKAYEAIETLCRELLTALGVPYPEAATGQAAWQTLLSSGANWPDLTDGIGALSNQQLDTLLLVALLSCFGTRSMEALDEGDTLFAHLANDLLTDLRSVWAPDYPFLKGLRRRQLVEIAKDVGAIRWRPKLAKGGQGELALELAEYFKLAAEGALDDKALDAKVRTWLPRCMQPLPKAASGEDRPAS